MISQQDRCIYRKNPLAEVICQLRFPEILSVEANLPAVFQDAIRSVFPQYMQHKVGPPNGKQTNIYQFTTADGVWRVDLTSKFISLSCCRYTRWEEFARMLDQPLAAFIKVYQPAYFQRIGLRYMNFISRSALDLEGMPFNQLIQPCYLGILTEDDVSEKATVRCTVDVDTALKGGCRVKLHAGPGKISRGGKTDPEVKFILDMDLYMLGNVPVNISAGALETLHGQSYGLFRGAVTKTLHDAMEPD